MVLIGVDEASHFELGMSYFYSSHNCRRKCLSNISKASIQATFDKEPRSIVLVSHLLFLLLFRGNNMVCGRFSRCPMFFQLFIFMVRG